VSLMLLWPTRAWTSFGCVPASHGGRQRSSPRRSDVEHRPERIVEPG
jgi:hypothetical protein